MKENTFHYLKFAFHFFLAVIVTSYSLFFFSVERQMTCCWKRSACLEDRTSICLFEFGSWSTD